MPLNRKYPIAELPLAACRSATWRSAARLHHSRVLHARRRQRLAEQRGQRCSRRCAATAAPARGRLQDQPDSLQLRFRPRACTRSPPKRVAAFAAVLQQGGIVTTVRRRAATTSLPPAASSPARCRTAPGSPSAHACACRCGSSVASRRPASRRGAAASAARCGARHDARRSSVSRRSADRDRAPVLIRLRFRDAAADAAAASRAKPRHRDRATGSPRPTSPRRSDAPVRAWSWPSAYFSREPDDDRARPGQAGDRRRSESTARPTTCAA